jgi:hypothetical protein
MLSGVAERLRGTPMHPPGRNCRAAQIEIRAGRGEGQALRTKENKLRSQIPAGRALAVAFAWLPTPQWPTVDHTNITAAATPVCQRASDSFVGARPSGQGRTPGDVRCGAGLLARRLNAVAQSLLQADARRESALRAATKRNRYALARSQRPMGSASAGSGPAVAPNRARSRANSTASSFNPKLANDHARPVS